MSSIRRRRSSAILASALALTGPAVAQAACVPSPLLLAAPTRADLVAAVVCANAASGEYVIDLGGQTVTLAAVHHEDAYAIPQGLPEITGRLRLINGMVARDPAGPDLRLLTVTGTGSLLIDSVVLSGGKIVGSGFRGGNVYNTGTLEIRNSSVLDGEANVGGGITNGGRLLMINSVVSGNRATYGAGLVAEGTSTVVVASTFEGNVAQFSGEGGAIYSSSSLDVIASRLAGNWAFNGGGILNYTGNVRISNSLIVGNYGYLSGGVRTSLGSFTATNVTVAGNASIYGVGGFDLGGGEVTINNSIAYGNTSDGNPSNVSLSFAGGQGNLFGVDPGFVSLAGAAFEAPTTLGDYRLTAGSAAIDAGVDAVAPPRHRSDYFGGQRHEGARIDAGADEFGNSRVLSTGFELPGSEFLP